MNRKLLSAKSRKNRYLPPCHPCWTAIFFDIFLYLPNFYSLYFAYSANNSMFLCPARTIYPKTTKKCQSTSILTIKSYIWKFLFWHLSCWQFILRIKNSLISFLTKVNSRKKITFDTKYFSISRPKLCQVFKIDEGRNVSIHHHCCQCLVQLQLCWATAMAMKVC